MHSSRLPTEPTNSRLEKWQQLLDGNAPTDQAAALGLTPAEATKLGEFHQASVALLDARMNQHLSDRRRVQFRAIVMLVVGVAIAGMWNAKTAFAQAMCASTLPAPLKTFCADSPAVAQDVNDIFLVLGNAIINKTGALNSTDITAQNITAQNITVNSGSIGFGSSLRQFMNHGTTYGVGVQTGTFYQRSADNFAWYLNGTHSDTELAAGPGGTRQMSLDGNGDLRVRGTVIATGGLRVRNYGDSAIASSGNISPEVYQLTSLPSTMTCDATNRGNIFVARPGGQNNQDSLCFCGKQDTTYEVWCFNP